MMQTRNAIYKIKNLDLNKINRDSPLDKWFHEMIQKNVDELTLKDISRMLRQEIYLDIALPIAYKMALSDPFCGEMYVGEMIELLTRVYISYPNERDKNFRTELIQKVQQQSDTFDWGSDYEKSEYGKLISRFNSLFE